MTNLKAKDAEDIKKFAENSPLAHTIKQYKNWKFSVGDVLIRKSIRTNDIDRVSETCPVPRKFRVIHIDELGIPWVKQLSVRGGLGNKLYNLMTYVQNFIWEVDPEQIDALILGYKYDPRAEYRRMRDENPEYGGPK